MQSDIQEQDNNDLEDETEMVYNINSSLQDQPIIG